MPVVRHHPLVGLRELEPSAARTKGGGGSGLGLVPCTLREANDFVASFHRHNGRTARNGGKWAVGAEVGGELVGVAIVGNPLSARFMDGRTAEVLRLCTNDRAPKNTCSMLYAACARAWRAMGGWRVVTYTLATESGASLRAAGWQVAAECAAGQVGKNWNKGEKRREWQPIFGQQKFRWEVETGARPKNGASQPNGKLCEHGRDGAPGKEQP